jgi:hypothetical protein
MAVVAYTPTTSTDLAEIWKNVQTKLHQGMKFMSEEWENMEDLKKFDVAWSSREILVPMDLGEGYGVASIEEGGYEGKSSFRYARSTVHPNTWDTSIEERLIGTVHELFKNLQD